MYLLPLIHKISPKAPQEAGNAKYYANEKMGVVTSINLYDYSFENNIEFGVLYENKLLNKLSLNTDNQVWNTCKDLANAHHVVYINRPMYGTAMTFEAKRHFAT